MYMIATHPQEIILCLTQKKSVKQKTAHIFVW